MAGRIPEQFIDDLLARVDIVELIESYLPLRKAGLLLPPPLHGGQQINGCRILCTKQV